MKRPDGSEERHIFGLRVQSHAGGGQKIPQKPDGHLQMDIHQCGIAPALAGTEAVIFPNHGQVGDGIFPLAVG